MFEFIFRLFGKGKKVGKHKKVEDAPVPPADDVGLTPQPVEINPPADTRKERATSRLRRLLDGRAQGHKVSDEEIEKYRLLSQD
jgi:hypothetical protein